MLNALLRFQGLAKESMIGLASGAIINIGLEPVFIFALHWGMMLAVISMLCICSITASASAAIKKASYERGGKCGLEVS